MSDERIPDQAGVQTAVIYARVSTDDCNQTVENQLIACRDYCRDRGYRVVGEYYEEYTGSTINRPKFLEMIGRLGLRDVNYVVAYDQSRLTRCMDTSGNFDKVREIINRNHAKICFVSTDIDPSSECGVIVTKLNDIQNARYNEELSRKTSLGMQTRRANGKHVGRPVAFMFAEDLESAPEGKFRKADPENGIAGTKVATEDYVMSFAREGYTLYRTAGIIGVTPSVLVAAMRPREEEPHRRLKKVAIAKARNPDYEVRDSDYVEFYRFHGTKDRYSEYMALYERATGARKGDGSERVGNGS